MHAAFLALRVMLAPIKVTLIPTMPGSWIALRNLERDHQFLLIGWC